MDDNAKLEKLRTIMSHMEEFLGYKKENFYNAQNIYPLSTFLDANYVDDVNDLEAELDAIKHLYIDKYEQAYSMAFYGFTPSMSKAFATRTEGSVVNDRMTYNKVMHEIARNTEQDNIFKYNINKEEWLLEKLEELDRETDIEKKEIMKLQLPEVIITPSDVKFSDKVTELLAQHNISVQRVGLEKSKDCVYLGDIVKYNYKTGMQDVNSNVTVRKSVINAVTGEEEFEYVQEINPDLKKAMEQINTEVAISKMEKQREVQMRKIADAKKNTAGMKSEEALDYILSEVEEMYKEYDADTYNHIIGMKQLVGTLDLGLPDNEKLTDVEKKNLERMVVLHDIGKLSMPKQIVASTQRLEGYQADVMKLHVSSHYANIFDTNIQEFNNDAINELLNLALNHHMGLEKEDVQISELSKNNNQAFDPMLNLQNGYGDKTVKNTEDKMVQMLHVLDVYNALRADRSYKSGFSMEKTVSIMNEDVEKYKMNKEYVDCLLRGVELEEIKNKVA